MAKKSTIRSSKRKNDEKSRSRKELGEKSTRKKK